MARPKIGDEQGGAPKAVKRSSAKLAIARRRNPDEPRSTRRVGERTRENHPLMAEFRGSLTDHGHAIVLAKERARRATWPRIPRPLARQASAQKVDRSDRVVFADVKNRLCMGAVIEECCSGRGEKSIPLAVLRVVYQKYPGAKVVAIP